MKEGILIIGCGEIGTSLVDGWLNKKEAVYKRISNISIIEKDKKRVNYLKKKYSKKIFFLNNKKSFYSSKKFKYVFLAFKPKDLNKDLYFYKNLFDYKTIFFSLLAGKKILDISSFFPIRKNIIRLMLNTPIFLNKGTIIYFSLKKEVKKKDLFLLYSLGDVFPIKNESLFDILTAVVGSGPAFFYLLIESMEKKAILSGLNKNFVHQILKKTFFGTASIVNESNYNFSELREKVTSKGGTTEAAMKYLQRRNFQKLIEKSIDESVKKAKNLSS